MLKFIENVSEFVQLAELYMCLIENRSLLLYKMSRTVYFFLIDGFLPANYNVIPYMWDWLSLPVYYINGISNDGSQ